HSRLGLIRPNQGRNAVQRIEQKMGINLAGKRGQTSLHEEPPLLFKLLLVPRVVPYLQRNRNREERGRVGRGPGQRRGVLDRRGEVEDQPWEELERLGKRLPEEFSHPNPCQELQVKGGTLGVVALKETVNGRIGERRKAPNLFGGRRQIAQNASQHTDY